MASETTVSPSAGSKGSTAENTASKSGSWIQRNKKMAIGIGVIVLVIIIYIVFKNRSSSSTSATGVTPATTPTDTTSGSISPSDLANLISQIPQGPPGVSGAVGATGAAGPPGPAGVSAPAAPAPPPAKLKNPPTVGGIATHPVTPPTNHTISQAAPPVHVTSQKPAVKPLPPKPKPLPVPAKKNTALSNVPAQRTLAASHPPVVSHIGTQKTVNPQGGNGRIVTPAR
jgi:hypothetical protein